MNVHIKGGLAPITDEERAEGNAKIIKHLEKKFITSRTPQEFVRRVDVLWPERVQAAVDMEVEPQTMKRWCRGSSRIPGNIWVLLGFFEKEKK